MRIQVRQTTHQQLIMAPNVKLALEILRMPTLELRAFLERQLEDNPLLELEESQYDEPLAAPTEPPTRDDTPAASLDEEWLSHWQTGAEQERPDYEFNEDRFLEQGMALTQSLQDSLRLQLGCQKLSEDEYRFGEAVIERISDDGYLQDHMEEIAAQTGASLEQLEGALKLVQNCDPPGIGARDLRECLMLQLERILQDGTSISTQPCAMQLGQSIEPNTREASAIAENFAYRILRDHFQLFASGRLNALAKAIGASEEEVRAACELLKRLEPKPGRSFAGELPPCVIPDLLIRQRERHYDVELSDQDIPNVSVNRQYYRMLKDPTTPADAKDFLSEKFRKASWLIRAIEERKSTILSIGRCLISLQREFLEQGPQALKPLTQMQVAHLIGRHPSTVSRAIAGKTIDTPYGVFRLEQLFATGIPQNYTKTDRTQPNYHKAHARTDEANERISDEAVKAQLQRLITEEDLRNPLSDTALVQRLAQSNLSVARRTVAKYRANLKILPAHLRKRRL